MFDSERFYIERLGLLSVIILSQEQFEAKGKLTVIEEIACFKNGKPYLMVVRWSKHPRLGYTYKIESKKEITDVEYKKFLKQ